MITQQQLNERLAEMRQCVTVKCRFTRPFAGGQPASDAGLSAFVQHHLGLAPETPEFKQAFDRIKKDEIGEKNTTPENGELQETGVYQVNVIRHGAAGPYIAEHQIKALLKQAASRLGLFVKTRGAKGDLAEMSTVLAAGDSLKVPDRPWEIYLDTAAPLSFDVISGSVNTAQGKKSIMHHTQVAPEGTKFSFALHWPKGKISADAITDIIAAATQIGLGSCLSLGYGRFEVESIE